jgi:coatomer subunit beta'
VGAPCYTQLGARVPRAALAHVWSVFLRGSLYNGHVHLWNFQTQTLLKTFEVTELPVRCSKFIARKQWIVSGSDDLFVRVFNYNTMEKIKTFEAHSDYLRHLAVHPTLPYVVTCSDDMTIKIWDWEKNWDCKQMYEGHSHYVMQVMFNPKDPNTFASASLDRTIKVWGLSSPVPHFTLEGHEKGVNCIDYFSGGDKPYLLSGADDKTVKVWDFQARTCVQTLADHSHNVSCVAFHPDLPIIITGSEDGSVRLFHSNTFNLENTLNYGMERVWSIGCKKGSNRVALGYDEGSVMIKLGKEQPVASMDASGKILWARHNEIQMVNLKSATGEFTDGERVPLQVKDLGSCDVYPQKLRHDPKGRNAVVCGDGEYIIYTALAWRNKSFGSALELVWANNGDYATREGTSKVKIFRDFKERQTLSLGYMVDAIFGGAMLACRSGEDFIFFYDWDTGSPVQRIDVNVKNVLWSENSNLVAISSDSSIFVLQHNKAAVAKYLDDGANEAQTKP